MSQYFYPIEEQINDCYTYLNKPHKNAYDMTESELETAKAELRQHFSFIPHPGYTQNIPKHNASGTLITGGIMKSKYRHFIITIDGPCGAGKTTTAKALAKRLNAMYLDTGGMYRALAYAFIIKEFDYENTKDEHRGQVAKDIYDNRITITYDKSGQMRFTLDSEDITGKIRTQQVSDASSRISVYPEIRDVINEAARKLALGTDIVAEGRDTGTFLFPNASIRYYLNAALEHRSHRRMTQTPDEFKTEQAAAEVIKNRDARDMGRKTAPLPSQDEAAARGLTIVNNENMTLEETIAHLYNDIRAKINS